MKTRLLPILTILIFAPLIFNSAYAELDKSLLKPFESNDLVVVGKVIQVNSIISENKTEYNIQVEEYLKGQRSFDMISVTLDDVRPTDFPNGPLDYYNKPYFEEGNQVLVYLNQDGGTFKMSPYSFTIKKKSVAGPPTVIGPTGPQGHFFSQGDEIIISGVIKKGYLYDLGKSEIDSSFHISILNEKEKQVESEKLILSPDGSYKFTFQSKDKFQIPGNYSWEITYENGGMGGEFVIVPDLDRWTPLKQIKSGVAAEEIQCKESLTFVTKYDGSPACVKPVTKQHLIDRNWAETKSLDEIEHNHNLIKQNIIRIEDGFISLYPENMCASISLDLPTEEDIQRYTNDEKGLKDGIILQITDEDLKEIPYIQELIYAVHSIEFPYNKYSSAYLDGLTFVEYEFFLMEKAMKKYGDSQEDYFIKLDTDYEERFSNPTKQGFTNHFEAPVIIYNDNVYSVSGTNFWTSDEHEPRRMSIFPIDVIEDDEKFIMLTDDDMESIPKIKEAIESIGTVKESVSAHKGLSEDQWNEYREWFEQKSQDRLYAEWFRFIQYDEQFYSVGFSIC